MNPCCYSGKPLVGKLGYKPGDTVYLLNSLQEFDKYLKDIKYQYR